MTSPVSRYLSAREIAELRLAGLPTTPQRVKARANVEGWPFVERAGRGGGRLYDWMDLPAQARTDYMARIGDEGAETRSRGRPRGTDLLSRDPALAAAIEAILADHQHTAANVAKLLRARNFEPPSRRSLQRFIQRISTEKAVLLASVRSPDAYKSRYRLALGSADGTVSYAHEVWEIDTTKADVMTLEGRKSILGIIDRYSRRARYEVVESESAQSVRRILINTIRAWGVIPTTLKVDHGSGFINQSIGSALELLDIRLDPCLPGHPEDKPFVERLFGTFQRERASLLKGFLGHNVAQAQQLRERARRVTGKAVIVPEITAAELQAIIDAWLDGEYHQRVHSRLRMSPMAKWQASPPGARRAPGEDVLKLALSAFVGIATVGKRGVQWKRGRYWSPALSAWMGRQVTIRRDEDDLGALFVFDEDGRYIATAVNFERAGMSEQQFALQARRQHEKWMAEQRAELRAKRRDFDIDTARAQLLRDEAEQAGKLVHLPPPGAPSSTPFTQSVETMDAPLPRTDAPRSADAPSIADGSPTGTAPFAPFRGLSDAEKIAEADAVLAAAAAGRDVDPRALARAQAYAGSSAYRASKIVDLHLPSQPARPRQRGAA